MSALLISCRLGSILVVGTDYHTGLYKALVF
jgi:hypothetical protein